MFEKPLANLFPEMAESPEAARQLRAFVGSDFVLETPGLLEFQEKLVSELEIVRLRGER